MRAATLALPHHVFFLHHGSLHPTLLYPHDCPKHHQHWQSQLSIHPNLLYPHDCSKHHRQSQHQPHVFPLSALTAPLNLHSLAANLPQPPFSSDAQPTLALPYPTAHPILNVHIHQYVKYQINTTGENFSTYRQTITFLLTMYKALDHITEGAAPTNPSDEWIQVDIHISLWFVNTLSPDLYRLVSGADGRACSTWTRLTRFFINNEASRHIYLCKAFHNTPCGDLSINAYASKHQNIADELAAIGHPITERDLTLQFIDGLGGKYKLQAEILKIAVPSFADTCSRLQLAEVEADAQQKQASAHAMAVQSAGRGTPSSGGAPPRPPGWISPNYRGKNPIPGFQYGGPKPPQYGNTGASSSSNGGGRGRG